MLPLLPLLFLPLASASPPNLVFFVVDDWGHFDAGYRGNPEIKTPTIDKIATEGVRLESYYAYQYCAPSRASLLSGRIPGHGISQANYGGAVEMGVNLNLTLLPAKLEQAGYSTRVQVGKWHLGSYADAFTPTHRGFSHSFGYLTGAVTTITSLFPQFDPPTDPDGTPHLRPCQGVDMWLASPTSAGPAFGHNGSCYNVTQPPTMEAPTCWEANWTQHYNGFQYERYFQEILDEHDVSRPFFAYVALQDTHKPMEVPPSFLDSISNHSFLSRAVYNAKAEAADSQIATMMASMRRRDEAFFNHTVFFLVGDNGASYGQGNNYPYRGSKYTMFEGGVRLNAAVWSPSTELLPASRRGAVVHDLVHVSDWYPTLCGLAGVDANDTGPGRVSVSGKDIWGMVSGSDPTPVHDFLLLRMNHSTNGQRGALVRADGAKIVFGPQPIPFWWGPLFPNTSLPCAGPEVAQHMMDFPHTAHLSSNPCPSVCSIEKPCIFNISNDPYEHNDLATSNPTLYQSLLSLYLEQVKLQWAPNNETDTLVVPSTTITPPNNAIIWNQTLGYHVHPPNTDLLPPGCVKMLELRWWVPWV